MILLMLYILLSVFHPVSHDGRMYAPVVQIFPNVRGVVIEVPIEANKPIKKGEVLFRIDPKPFQIEVDRLRASLATKNVNLAQLSEQLAEAEAATKQAQANQFVSESQFEPASPRELRTGRCKVAQVNKQLDLAKQNLARVEPLAAKLVATQQDLDVARTRVLSLEEENKQATAAAKRAKEQMKTGNKSLEAVRAGHCPA